MADAQFTKSFVFAVNGITEDYKAYLIKENGTCVAEAISSAEELNDMIYDHADYEALLPLARTRELINPLRRSKFDCQLGQLQFRSVLIPPVWRVNKEVKILRYHKIFHASSRTLNSESVDDLFDD